MDLMAKPSKKDVAKLDRARARIDTARRFRSQEAYDTTWERLVDLYAGKHFPKALSSQDLIAINVAKSTIDVIAPSVAVNHPKAIVKARRMEYHDQAAMIEAWLNWAWSHYDFQEEFRLAVNDMLQVGHGWIKTGWRFVEEEVDNPDYESQVDELFGERDAFAAENPDLSDGLADDDELLDQVPTKVSEVAEDRPFVERVSPFDIFVDPAATTLRNAGWIAQRSFHLLQEVEANEEYEEYARKHVQADAHSAGADLRDSTTNRLLDPDDQWVTVWEFWDITAGTMCVFAESGEGYLKEPEDQPYSFGHPFIMMRNYEVVDRFYPMGELESLEPLQHELNMTRSALLNDRKQYKRKWIADEGAFDATGRAALESEKDNTIVFTNGGVPINEAIIPMPSQAANPQLYQNSEMIESDITLVTGLNEYQRGMLPETTRTATEAGIIQEAANARAADKLSRIEKTIGKIAENLVQLAQQYMTEPQQIARFAPGNEPIWFDFTPDDIQGEYDFEVAGGSTMPLNDTQRRQTAMQMLQTFMPLAELGIINPAELVRHVLVEGFGISNPERFLAPPPPPPEEEVPVDDPTIAPSAAPQGPEGAEMGASGGSVAGSGLSAPGGTPNGGMGAAGGGFPTDLPPELIQAMTTGGI